MADYVLSTAIRAATLQPPRLATLWVAVFDHAIDHGRDHGNCEAFAKGRETTPTGTGEPEKSAPGAQ